MGDINEAHLRMQQDVAAQSATIEQQLGRAGAIASTPPPPTLTQQIERLYQLRAALARAAGGVEHAAVQLVPGYRKAPTVQSAGPNTPASDILSRMQRTLDDIDTLVMEIERAAKAVQVAIGVWSAPTIRGMSQSEAKEMDLARQGSIIPRGL